MTMSQGQPFVASFKTMACIKERTELSRTILFHPLDVI